MVLSGRLRQAVRRLTNRDGGGVLQPDEECTKAGVPVLQVLRSKHPALRVPELDTPDCKVFESYPELPAAIPMEVTAEHVELVASRLSGAAGCGGTDAVDLRNWLLRFGAQSETLRIEMAAWVEWLANESPPYAAYRATMMCRLVALDKQPGTRPVGIGEIWRRLWAKVLLHVCGDQATQACGNFNLCAGLPAGIEGAIHAVGKRSEEAEARRLSDRNGGQWVPPAGWPPGMAPPTEEDVMHDCATAHQPPLPSDTRNVPPEPTDMVPEALLLVDARNGFNELNRMSMLWTVRHRWAAGARFSFNCYRHAATLIVRRPGGKNCATVLSEEGVTQGDPLAMVLYGLALLPLAESLREAEPTVLQPWYADDMAMQGPVSGIARVMRLLQVEGPPRGYFPEPAKSILVCDPSVRTAAEAALMEFNFSFADGFRYVGGFMGTEAAREAWLAPQIATWVNGIRQLSKVAARYPQTAFAGLARSLQSEWQYVQRISPGTGPAFAPVESALRDLFLPALLGASPSAPLDETIRHQSCLSTKFAGLGVPDPTQTADECHMASVRGTAVLAASLLRGVKLDAGAHSAQVSNGRRTSKKQKLEREEKALNDLKASVRTGAGRGGARESRRLDRARETGGWLNILPDSLNGTELSTEEFRDSLRLRMGLIPNALPEKCDGCGHGFTVEHALTCKKGGLVVIRHNDLAAEWHELCATALTPSAVSDEPLIHTGRAARGEQGSSNVPGDPGPGADNPEHRELRGDVSAHGFWRRGTTAIFDVRIADTDAPGYRGQDPKKILARHEKAKEGQIPRRMSRAKTSVHSSRV